MKRNIYLILSISLALYLLVSIGCAMPEKAEVTIEPLPDVTGLIVNDEGYTEVTLCWTPPVYTDFASVEITSSPAITPVTVPKGTNTSTITGLVNGTGYTFTVKSVNSGGRKSTGVQKSATPVSTLTVTYNGNDNTGGSVPADSTPYNFNGTVTVSENTGVVVKIPAAGTAEAFKFGGWNTRADGSGTTYPAGTGTFTIAKNTTLYAKWVKFELRDIGPAGGWIFYDKGNFSDGWRYLEAAPMDWGDDSDPNSYQAYQAGFGYVMINGDVYNYVGGLGFNIGTGKNNTARMVARINTDTAAWRCYDFTVTNGGVTFNDWFLPSYYELQAMYTELKVHGLGNFNLVGATGTGYWSSTECIGAENRAHWVNFYNGDFSNWVKGSMKRLRFARMF